MKKLLLIFACFAACNCFCQTDKSNEQKITAGIDIGFTSDAYLPISFYVGYKKVHYGMTFGFDVNNGTQGKQYDNINWDELRGDHLKEGSYYTPFSFDIGYNIYKNFVLGAGIGYAIKTRYRNCFDDFYILGNNGHYFKTKADGGNLEYKVYCSYYIPSNSFCTFYLKAHYSAIMGTGGSLGIAF